MEATDKVYPVTEKLWTKGKNGLPNESGVDHPGIDLRTLFAGLAMSSLITHYGDYPEAGKDAVRNADALIKELNK